MPQICTDGDIRLRDWTYDLWYLTRSSRVEVCHNGSYIAVCSNGLGDREIEVISSRYGYRPPNYSEFLNYKIVLTIHLLRGFFRHFRIRFEVKILALA